jgi:hypothetical protein
LDEEDSITHDGIHVIYLYKIMENEIYEKKNPYFSFISSRRRNIYLLNIPPQIPPLPFFSDFWERKRKKIACIKQRVVNECVQGKILQLILHITM